MRTIGKRYSKSRPKGDYPAVDDYTGAVYYRSDMERDMAGNLRKRRARRERDRVELAMLEQAHSEDLQHERPFHDGNAADIGSDDVEPAQQLKDTISYTNFWGD